MEQEISIGIAKYFFNKGIELDLDNVFCWENNKGILEYWYREDLILTVDSFTEKVELHYVEVVG